MLLFRLQSPKNRRLEQLKTRISLLTDDYASFFAAVPDKERESVTVLSHIQHLRRVRAFHEHQAD